MSLHEKQISLSQIPPSRVFTYKNKNLFCEDVLLSQIAEKYDTPTYLYSEAAIRESFHQISAALSFRKHMIAYAVKANGNLSILRLLAEMGSGADIVSKGEMLRALQAGFPPSKIVYSGVGKRKEEIEFAIEKKIKAINVESASELRVIAEVAKSKNENANVCLRINPNVDAKTHPYIATGLKESKFGLSIEQANEVLSEYQNHPFVTFVGMSCHIGSQLSSTDALKEAVTILGRFCMQCLEKGFPLTWIDVGGGWPMNYGNEKEPYPAWAAFGKAIEEGLQHSGVSSTSLELLSEPGRALVGDAGALLTKVLYTKKQGAKKFVIVDAAMTELIRPSLYGAYHALMPLKVDSNVKNERVDIVGPVCESGDFLAKDRELPSIKEDDLLIIRGAGAYAREMASTYNGRLAPSEILISGSEITEIRKRAQYESLWAGEV
jgi:diaminopimelate decarboxylase